MAQVAQLGMGQAPHSAAPVSLPVPAFVGREAEFAELAAALAQPPAVVLVEGEAGVGKSRLVQEFLGSAAGLPRRRVLLGVCPPFRESLTLGPVVDAVRQACDGVAGLGVSDLVGALRPMFPEWVADLPAPPEPLEDAGASRHRLFRALAELVSALDTTVIVVEDVHWADDATLEFLLFLAARPHSRLNVMVTYRPEDVPARSLLLRLSSRLPAGTTRARVTLAPLDVTATARLISSMLGGEPVSEAFAGYLHERTDGLPLAVEESVRLLRNRADLDFRDGEWVRRSLAELQVPPTVRDSVLERVQRLGPDARWVLRAASVLAEPADDGVLRAVAGVSGAGLRAGLVEAVASGLLGEDERGRVGFRHVLMGAAVYEAMPGGERRRSHAAAGRALEAGSPPPLPQLTRHFRAAGDTGAWCRYAELAADQAVASDDYTAAVTMLNDLLNDSPGAVALDAGTRARLAGKLATTATVRREPVDALHGQVITTVRAVLDTPGLNAAQRAGIRGRLSRLLLQSDAYDAARAELDHSVAHLEDDPVEAARTMIYLGFPYTWPWPASVHLEWLRRAAALTATVESTVDRLALTADRATALLLLGEPAGWDVAAELPVTAPTVEQRHPITRGHSNIGQVAITWGRYAEAGRLLALALKLAEADQFQRIRRATIVAQIRLDWLTGRWMGLPERIAGLAAPDESDPRDQIDSVGIVAALLDAAAGAQHDAEQRLDAFRGEARSRGMLDFWLEVAAVLARLRMAAGRVDEVLDVTDEPMRTVSTKGIWVWATDLAPVRVEALTTAGRAGEAARLVTALARGLRGRDAPGPRAALATCRALLGEGRGDDPARTARAFDRAAAAWDLLPRPYDALLAQERQAGCLIGAGQAEVGLELLSTVFRGLTELGAPADADRVARRLAAYGVRPRQPWRGGRRGYGDQLSPRELEVVRLVVAGGTNREIAATLSRSPHTVAKQLHAAMRKLGVTSRTALAVSAVEAGTALDAAPPGGTG